MNLGVNSAAACACRLVAKCVSVRMSGCVSHGARSIGVSCAARLHEPLSSISRRPLTCHHNPRPRTERSASSYICGGKRGATRLENFKGARLPSGRITCCMGESSEMAFLEDAGTAPVFTSDITVQTIENLTADIQAHYLQALDRIEGLELAECTFGNTAGALAEAHGVAAERSASVTLPGFVHADKDVRAASNSAKDVLKKMFDTTFLRQRVYQRLAAVNLRDLPDGSEERRLTEGYLAAFERMGSALGLSPASEGSYNVSLKAPEMVPVTQMASSEAARKKMTEAKGRQCLEANRALLEEVLRLRHECATMLGHESHAEYAVAPKMAAHPDTAVSFQRRLVEQLRPALAADKARLLDLKQSEVAPAGGEQTSLQAWDTAYYTRVHKETLGVDETEIQKYFPMEHVKRETLRLYEELLCLRFQRLPEAQVWHNDVEAYAVYDDSDGEWQLCGHFFLDLHPRAGKYSHQCVYPLRPAYVHASEEARGDRVHPACVIIGNMTKSTSERPALMRFREVETFFHEFGHVVHCVCAKVKHSPFAWAWSAVPWPGGVQQDFLEVPSMMLENWMYSPDVLRRLSQHFERPDESLPADVIRSITESRSALCGLHYQRQLFLGMYDLAIHSGPVPYSYNGKHELDATQLYHEMMADIAGVKCPEGTFPAASWYHLCMGYDAGYYGYLWSEVYAADLFSEFHQSEAGCMNSALGRRYRDMILSRGAAEDGMGMLRGFLQREPSQQPFLERVGI
ncbi:hypothetical protein CYMTET_23084 [Cymbomonas tetramitiformis]|uniref:Peptidase M3A/M3B catalytic domain-containing protein n=1 Tax=Cymbomonas tetramitiformis TaxID=36881 RepID=A0AAE0G043_9CHLO|nr:hypothetical protein CYMTET_23084 [Cymbomonas tetramitiformis]